MLVRPQEVDVTLWDERGLPMVPSHSVIKESASQFWHPRRLGHANIFIGSYERAADYYRDIVGFTEVYRQPNNMAAFMSNGNTYHDLGLTDIHSRYCKPGQKPGPGGISPACGGSNGLPSAHAASRVKAKMMAFGQRRIPVIKQSPQN